MSSLFSRRSLLLSGAGLALTVAATRRLPARAQDAGAPPFASPANLPTIEARADGPLNVVTSTSILADLARQIGGERVQATSILPPMPIRMISSRPLLKSLRSRTPMSSSCMACSSIPGPTA